MIEPVRGWAPRYHLKPGARVSGVSMCFHPNDTTDLAPVPVLMIPLDSESIEAMREKVAGIVCDAVNRYVGVLISRDECYPEADRILAAIGITEEPENA